MHRAFFIVANLLGGLLSIASNSPKGSDSLRIIWNDVSQADTTRLNAINALITTNYLKTNPDSAYYWAEVSHRLASTQESKKHVALSWKLLGRSSSRLGLFREAIDHYTQWLKLNQELRNASEIASANNGLGVMYYYLGESRKAIEYYTNSLEIYKNGKDSILYQKVLGNVGVAYYECGEYDLALEYHTQVLSICEKMDYKRGAAIALNNISNIYSAKGQITEAIEYCFKSLKLHEREEGNERDIAGSLHNIGNLYYDQGQLNMAIKYLRKGLRVRVKIGDKRGVAGSLNNIATIFRQQNKNDSSILYNSNSLRISKEIGDKRGMIESLIGLGGNYFEEDKYEFALKNLHLARKLSLEVEDQRGEAAACLTLGLTYKKLNEYDNAVKFGEQALKIGQEISELNIVRDAAAALHILYKQKSRHKKSLQVYELYVIARDSLINDEAKLALNKQQLKYEFEKKEAAKQAEFDKQTALKEVEIKRQKQVGNISIAASALLLCIGGAWFFSYRKKQRITSQLMLQSEKLKRQKASIEAQEEERKRVAKELHDGLGSFLAGIKMSLASVERKSPSIDKTITDLGEACKEVRNISHDLMPSSVLGDNFVAVVRNYVKGIGGNNQFKVDFDAFPEDLLNNMPEGLQVDIYRVIQELVNNIRKHSKATKVEVGISAEDNKIELIVEDDGEGFDKKKVRQGIGLKNIQTRVNQWDGELKIESSEGKGSTFMISFRAA